MQVPERLALIGGSILLASTLVFTLKSQASSIIPNVSHSISGVFDHIGDAQKVSDFDSDYQQAQKKGWKTGNWGRAKFYVDDQHNMYVGSGNLQGDLHDTLSGSVSDNIRTINFTGKVVAPEDSSFLLDASFGYDNNTLTQINGIDNLDTSHVKNMSSMFESDATLKSLDLSSWDTSNVERMDGTFYGTKSLQSLNVSNWNTSKVNYMANLFWANSSLQHIDLSNWDTSNVGDMNAIFNGESVLKQLTLGNNTRLKGSIALNGGTWKNDNRNISDTQFSDSNPYPGTWTWIHE